MNTNSVRINRSLINVCENPKQVVTIKMAVGGRKKIAIALRSKIYAAAEVTMTKTHIHFLVNN